MGSNNLCLVSHLGDDTINITAAVPFYYPAMSALDWSTRLGLEQETNTLGQKWVGAISLHIYGK